MSTPIDDATRATVRQLAGKGMSQRAIGRELGIHHSTVARALRATDEPDEPADEPDEPRHEPQDAPPHEPDEPDTAPPPPTSGAPRTPRLIHDLPGWLVQDLNVLIDPFTGRLDEPVARTIHTAAEQRRATWRANAERRASHPSHDTATAQ
ncbi:helix-turn-helix domain-containing protein [Streptomyces sp. NPDC088353]|uniref:helix-turn-helix domain-containing protein n=1 Tax=Streptomyces sp. NPDC088353 TaxID=3365855 RepID=UPI0037F5E925